MHEHLPKKSSVAIIGAGIAGLSCATQLKVLGFEVQIFEKSRGPSGRMSTRNGDGWSADHGAHGQRAARRGNARQGAGDG